MTTYMNNGNTYNYAETLAKLIRALIDFESANAGSKDPTTPEE